MYEPIIIIGAPRSGTNMLRDLCCRLPGVGTWPCDEINYIWRHGNMHHPSDALPPTAARDEVSAYIRRQFDCMARKLKVQYLIEKTCANSLRVEFVARIFPEARYIYIVRNALDVVASAEKRWHSELDIPYLARKARYVPPQDFPYYLARFVSNRFRQMRSPESRLKYWGPTLDNMDNLIRERDSAEICALQWQACVDASDNAFAGLPQNRILKIRYEDLVTDPVTGAESICGFLNLEQDADVLKQITSTISASSIGKGQQDLGAATSERILPIVSKGLERHGY